MSFIPIDGMALFENSLFSRHFENPSFGRSQGQSFENSFVERLLNTPVQGRP
jgi:hypothetical protein